MIHHQYCCQEIGYFFTIKKRSEIAFTGKKLHRQYEYCGNAQSKNKWSE